MYETEIKLCNQLVDYIKKGFTRYKNYTILDIDLDIIKNHFVTCKICKESMFNGIQKSFVAVNKSNLSGLQKSLCISILIMLKKFFDKEVSKNGCSN